MKKALAGAVVAVAMLGVSAPAHAVQPPTAPATDAPEPTTEAPPPPVAHSHFSNNSDDATSIGDAGGGGGGA